MRLSGPLRWNCLLLNRSTTSNTSTTPLKRNTLRLFPTTHLINNHSYEAAKHSKVTQSTPETTELDMLQSTLAVQPQSRRLILTRVPLREPSTMHLHCLPAKTLPSRKNPRLVKLLLDFLSIRYALTSKNILRLLPGSHKLLVKVSQQLTIKMPSKLLTYWVNPTRTSKTLFRSLRLSHRQTPLRL